MNANRGAAFFLPPPIPGTRLPDFLLIGSMKAGTTTLSEWLRQHPDLLLCRPKEPQFFSRADAASRGWEWYGSLFDAATEGQLVGEASTCYTRWPHFGDVAGRLWAHVPDARLIFVARHPVERAYSHYRHEMQRLLATGEEPLPFGRALEEFPDIIDASLYSVQLDQYLAHYPAERLLVVTTEDLRDDAAGAWTLILSFLGVEPAPLPVLATERANAFGDHLAKRVMRERLAAGSDSPLRRIVRACVPDSFRRRVRRVLIDPRTSRRVFRARLGQGAEALSPLTVELRSELLERFAQTTDEMEARLGRELPEWRR